MDEQDPRLGVERLGGPGDEELTDLKYSAPTETEQLPDDRTREIRAEIEQTRENMSETVNAIQDRLRPSTLASNAAERVKDAAMDKFRDVADSESVMYVRANPIPAAMVGIGVAGLAWLAMGGRESRSSDGLDRGVVLTAPGASGAPFRRTIRAGFTGLQARTRAKRNPLRTDRPSRTRRATPPAGRQTSPRVWGRGRHTRATITERVRPRSGGRGPTTQISEATGRTICCGRGTRVRFSSALHRRSSERSSVWRSRRPNARISSWARPVTA